MRYLRTVLRCCRVALLAIVGFWGAHGSALAQMQGEGENKGGSYVISYTLVLIGVGLGVFFVCRSARRRDRARPQQYEQLSDLDG